MSNLSKLGKALNGKPIPQTHGNYPAYGGNGIIDNVNSFNYPENTIIIGRVGANCGAVYFSYEKCWVTDNALAFIVKDNDPYFVYCLLRIINLNKFHIGSSQPLITQGIINSIEVNYIKDIKTQHKISNILKVLDDKIENNNKIITELEALTKTIYDYWFLQFEFPNKDGKPYKTSGGKMVWSKKLKKEIPEGWKVQNLQENELTKIITPGIQEFNRYKLYLPTANVNGNNIIEANYITFNNRETRANMQPQENSIWFAKMKNSIKHIFVGKYAKNIIDNYIFSTGFLGLRCVVEDAYEYICAFINTNYFEIIKNTLAHGATQEAVSNEDIKSIPLIIPNNDVLIKYHKKTMELYKKIYVSNQEKQELTKLRDFLLPLLMNGQIGFKE